MVFYPPSCVPALPDLPDSITLDQFISDERYGRYSIATAKNPYTCGITGKTYSAAEVIKRTDFLARAISKRLGFAVGEGTEWDKVVALYSVNTIDYIPFTQAVHRLSGIVTPASAAYSASELEHQLRSSGAKALFTSVPLLDNALKAAKAVGIPDRSIFILHVPGAPQDVPFKTVDDLIAEGRDLPELAPLSWIKGQGARQVAYLCYSSGTSGLPKAVMVSHQNIIANVVQTTLFDREGRKSHGVDTQSMIGVLPFSHIYALTLVALLSQYRGDQVVVLPRFELKTFLSSIQQYRVEQLSIVPPILIQMLIHRDECEKYDLRSIRLVFSGAAPLGVEVMQDLAKLYPKWFIGQGYGMTEASPLVVTSSEIDLLEGSSGSLLSGLKAKVVDTEGREVAEYESRGELLIQGPSVTLGYLNNQKATAETYVWDHDGRWLKTGDEVLVRKSEHGHEHFFITDRIKELIKVKGHQVAPAELEAHLLGHVFVSDCAVISIQDPRSGEVPKAFVVKTKAAAGTSDDEIVKAINKHVETHKARHKWLKGGIEFIDAIPKSASGKILRRLLRDRERQAHKAAGAKFCRVIEGLDVANNASTASFTRYDGIYRSFWRCCLIGVDDPLKGPTAVQLAGALLGMRDLSEEYLPVPWKDYARQNPEIATTLRRSVAEMRSPTGEQLRVTLDGDEAVMKLSLQVFNGQYAVAGVPDPSLRTAGKKGKRAANTGSKEQAGAPSEQPNFSESTAMPQAKKQRNARAGDDVEAKNAMSTNGGAEHDALDGSVVLDAQEAGDDPAGPPKTKTAKSREQGEAKPRSAESEETETPTETALAPRTSHQAHEERLCSGGTQSPDTDDVKINITTSLATQSTLKLEVRFEC